MGKSIEQEYEAAFEQHADEMFRHAYFRVSDREQALDVVQDAFTKTWDYLSAGNTIENYRAFLFRTLNNLIVDYYRKKRSSSLDALLEKETITEGHFEDLRVGSLEEVESKLDAKLFLSELGRMPEAYKDVVAMRFLDELSPREIASMMGVSENVVSVRIHRGLKWLREHTNHE